MDSRRGVSRARRSRPMRKSLSRAVAWLLVFCMCMANMNSAAFAAEIASASNAVMAATPSDAVATGSNAMEILMPEETISGEALQEEAIRAISEGNEFKFESEIKVLKDSEGRDKKYDDLFKGYKTFLLFADNDQNGKLMGDNENAYGYIVVRISEDEYREFEKENGTAKKKKATPSDATDSNASERSWELTGNEDLIFLYVNTDDGDVTFSLNIEDLDTEDIVVPSYRELQEIQEEEKEAEEEETENPAAQPAEDGNEAGGNGGGSGSGGGSAGGGSGSGSEDGSAETGGNAGNEDGSAAESGAAGNEDGETAGSGAAGNEDGETADSEGAGNENGSEPDGEGAGNGGEAGTDGEKPDGGSSESAGNEPGEGQGAGGSQSDNGNHENGGQAGSSENENGAGHGTSSDGTAGTGGQGGNENAGGQQEGGGSGDVSEKPGNGGGNAGHASGDKGDGGQTGGNAGSGSSDKGTDKGGAGSSDKGNSAHTDKGNTGSGSGSSAGGSGSDKGTDKGGTGSSDKGNGGSSDTAKLSKSSYSVPLVMGPNPDAGFETEDELSGIEDFDEWQEMMEEAEEEEEDEEEDDVEEVSISYDGGRSVRMTALPALTATVKKTEKTRSLFRSLFKSKKVSEIEAVVAAGVMPLAQLGEQEYDEAEHHKRVVLNDDGTYTLTLDVKGMNPAGETTETTVVPADIMFVLDKSGSMGNPMDITDDETDENPKKVKLLNEGVKGILESVFQSAEDVPVNVAGVLYDDEPERKPLENSQWGWYQDAETAIQDMKISEKSSTLQGGTYPAKPLQVAMEHLKEARKKNETHVQFLIYLTDGMPDEEAEKSVNVLKKASGMEGVYFYPITIHTMFAQSPQVYMTDIKNAALQSAMIVSDEAPYMIETVDEFREIFLEIKEEIVEEINIQNAGMSNVVIKDQLSQYADFADKALTEDSFTVERDNEALTRIKEPNGEGDYTLELNKNEKTFTVAFKEDLKPGSKYSVSVDIKPSEQAEAEYKKNGNAYASEGQTAHTGEEGTGTHAGKEGFRSNTEAELTYNYANVEQEFEYLYLHPVLQIIEKSGQFAVRKVINGGNGENKTEDGLKKQQKFIINIEAVEDGEPRTYSSIALKGGETSPYITAEEGQQFRISEICPMEYEEGKITVTDDKGEDVTEDKLSDGLLTVAAGDKLLVTVENNFNHKGYFHSSYDVTNKTTGDLNTPFETETSGDSPAKTAAKDQPKTELAKKKVDIEEEEGETLV